MGNFNTYRKAATGLLYGNTYFNTLIPHKTILSH